MIPTYNRAALLPATLDAVFAQSRAPDEVIVVDDGSTDGTLAVLSAYAGKIAIITIPNSGDLGARNAGTRAATGTLVAYCDSDDVWEVDFLRSMASLWDHVPDLLGAYSNFRVLQGGVLAARDKFAAAPPRYWADLRAVAPGLSVFDQDLTARMLVFQPFFPSCLMVDRARFMAAGGWDEGVSRFVGGDFATGLRIGALPPMGIVRDALVRIRKHAGNFSADTERMNLGDAQVLDHVLQTREFPDAVRLLFRRSIAARRVAAMQSAFGRQDYEAVREIAKRLPFWALDAKSAAKIAVAKFLPRV